MTYADIRNAITKILYDTFKYKVYTEEVQQGLKRPCFFVQIIPISTTNFTAYKNRLINVDITYFSENETIEEILEMQDNFEALFNLNLNVLDRSLLIKDLDFKTVDNNLHCIFILDYFEDTTKEITVIGLDKQVYKTQADLERMKDLGYTETNIETMQNLEIEGMDN